MYKIYHILVFAVMPLEHKLLLRRPSIARLFQHCGIALIPTKVPSKPSNAHSHDVHEAVLIRKGSLLHDIAGYKMESRADHLDLVPPHSIHRYQARSKDVEIINILIDPKRQPLFAQTVINQNLAQKSTRICQIDLSKSKSFWPHIDGIIEEQRSQQYAWEKAIQLHAENFFLHCERAIHKKHITWFEDQRSHGINLRFEALLQRIDSNPQQNWRLAKMAKELNISKEHLCRRFQQRCQCTAHQYISQRRIEIAQQLLLQKRSVEQAAIQAGFTSSLACYRAFKAQLNQSPKQWLKQQA